MDAFLDRRKYTPYSGTRRGRLAIIWQMMFQEFKYSMKQKSIIAMGAFAILSSAFVVIILTSTGVLGLVTSKQMAFVANLDPSFLTEPTLGGMVDNTKAIFVNYFWKNSFFTFLLILLVAVVGSRLISRDLESKVLSLYFTRPLKRIDYIIGKLGTLILVVLSVTFLPALVTFAYLLLMSDQVGLKFIIDHLWVVPALFLQSMLIAVGFGSLALVCSSLTPKRMFAGGTFLLIILGSMVTAGLVEGMDLYDRAQYLNIPFSIQRLCSWFMSTGALKLYIAPIYIGIISIGSLLYIYYKLSRNQFDS